MSKKDKEFLTKLVDLMDEYEQSIEYESDELQFTKITIGSFTKETWLKGAVTQKDLREAIKSD